MIMMLKIRNLIIVLLLVFNISSTTTTSFTPRVEYINYISATTGSYSINYNGTTTTKVFTTLMHSDDSPFQEFTLPFSFPFFGSDIYRIFVSPNGGIHTDNNQPCTMCNCYGDDADCSMSSSYYKVKDTTTYIKVGYANVIAGILYDLLPANSTTNGNISAIYSNTAVTIKYDKIKVFGLGVEYSFDITLFNDGSVIINYGTVTSYPDTGKWASGMRGPRSTSYTSDNFVFKYANLSTAQISAKSVWKTKYSGIYPNTTKVGGKYFVICPMSMTWTATAVNVNITNYDSIYFKPISISCTSIFSLGSLVIGISNSTTASTVETCSYNPGFKRFSCKLSTVLGTSPSTGNYPVYFKWKESTHSTSWSNMNANPITFNFGAALDPAVCAINDYTTSSCNACDIYNNNNFACFNLSCASTQLYSRTDCKGKCWTSATLDTGYYLSDIYGTCCSLDDIDCTGQCYGTQSLGYSALTSTMTIDRCCNADCNNKCDGITLRDACGTCGGTDNSGKTCSTFVSVSTGSKSSDIYVNMTAINPTKPFVNYVNISNTNDTAIFVKFQVTGSSFLGPDITVSKSKTQVIGNSSMLFTVNTSLESMINGNINGWEVKKVYVQYTRPSYSDFTYSYSINVYPKTSNCSAISNRNTCMRLPGCIFCYTYPAVRVLEETDSVSANNEKDSLWRRLFINIMAEQAGIRTYSLAVGNCVDGWNTDDCPATSSNGFKTINSSIILYISLIIFFMCIVVY